MRCKNIKKTLSFIMIIALTLFCFTLFTGAAVNTVDNYNELVTAVYTAESGTIIQISQDLNFDFTITIPIGKSVTITSSGGIKTLTVGANRHFTVYGELILEDIILQGDGTSENTGGILVMEGSLIINDGTIITNCRSKSYGGGVYSINSNFFMNGGNITNNSAAFGGGIYLAGSSKLTLTNGSQITQNNALNEGGGIFTQNYTGFDQNNQNDYSDVTEGDYVNLILDESIIFEKNTASKAYFPPENADELFPNIEYSQSSITDKNEDYFHPLNNYDINYVNQEMVFYTITYNGNDGSNNPLIHQDQKYTLGESYTILTDQEIYFLLHGYAFTGWNINSDGSGTAYLAGQAIEITGDLTLYAQWETETIPMTGDFKNTGLWVMLTLSLLGIAVCLKYKKKIA